MNNSVRKSGGHSDVLIFAQLEKSFECSPLAPVEVACSQSVQIKVSSKFFFEWKTLPTWWLRFPSNLKFLSLKISPWCPGLWDQIVFLCHWKSPLQTLRTDHSRDFTEATHLVEKHDFILAWFVFKSGQWFRCEWADCSWALDQIRLPFIFRNSLDQLWRPQRDVLWLRSANYKNSNIHC